MNIGRVHLWLALLTALPPGGTWPAWADELPADSSGEQGTATKGVEPVEEEGNQYPQYPMGLGIERQPERLWVLPILNYVSDLGPGYGLLLSYRVTDTEENLNHALRLVAFTSALKAHRLRAQWERTPGPAGVHLMTDASFEQTYYSNYFGIGNDVAPVRPVLDTGDPSVDRLGADLYTQFTLQQSYVGVLAQRGIHGEKRRAFAVARVRDTNVLTFDPDRVGEELGERLPSSYATLLEEERPYGFTGGWSPMVQVGLMSDSRDKNVAPNKGAFHEVSVRGLGYLPQGDEAPGAYAGLNVTLRRYAQLRGPVVLASRLVGDITVGDVPFFDMAVFGASDPYTGLGGTLAGRGMLLRHYVGRAKILWGPEIRYTPLHRTVSGDTMDVSFAIFADSGRVWEDFENHGGKIGLHTGVGAGVRMVWADRLLVRLDVAKSLRDDDPLGIYLVFGHPY